MTPTPRSAVGDLLATLVALTLGILVAAEAVVWAILVFRGASPLAVIPMLGVAVINPYFDGAVACALFVAFVWTLRKKAPWFESWHPQDRLMASLGASIVGVCLVGCCLAVAVLGAGVLATRQDEGKWPFKPLAHSHHSLALANGGEVEIDNRENTGHDGIKVLVTYQPPGSAHTEPVSYDYLGGPRDGAAYSESGLVAVALDDEDELFVRGPEGKWKAFHINKGFLNPADISPADIRKIYNGEAPRPDDFGLLKGFDADHHVLVDFFPHGRSRRLQLAISPDGKTLRYVDTARIPRKNKAP